MVSRYITTSLTTAVRAHFPAAARIIAATGCLAPAAAIVSSTAVAEAMATPAVTVAPAGPWAHAQKYAAIKVPRPIKSIGRAGVRCIVVIAVRTNGWNADVYDKLSLNHWRQGQTRQQCCRSDKSF